MTTKHDVVVVGAGPNGLTAAALLAARGLDVLLLERAEHPGGGTRTEELTLPGFLHDVCSAVHPMGCLSPAFAALDLEDAGVEWVYPTLSVAHPLDEGPSATLACDIKETAKGFGRDEPRYRTLIEPFLRHPEDLFGDVLSPLKFPRRPFRSLRLAWYGLRSAQNLADRCFTEDATRALFAGCAGHAILPFDRALTAAVGLVFLLAAHIKPWPVAKGGSQSIAEALVRRFLAAGGTMETGREVRELGQLPEARAYVFDLAPTQLAAIASEALPIGYREKLLRYRMGPGAFKLDWALDGPIPWKDPTCLDASTVHLGGRFEEIAAAEAQVWNGEAPERPFVLLTQQSQLDPSRAPVGKHTGYAYCHVPAGCTVDMTEAIEAQVERFAPGFRDRILARHVLAPQDFEARNPSHIGGAITGGVADLWQFLSRPTLRLNPYTTPNPRLFLCSHSAPPGGGVHGMCGYHAASIVLRRVFGKSL